jgi:hypothetical protein
MSGETEQAAFALVFRGRGILRCFVPEGTSWKKPNVSTLGADSGKSKSL